MDITAFWYNPNIHPYTEYKQRMSTLREFCQREAIQSIIQDDYALEAFISMAVNGQESRCKSCYVLRLQETAKQAAEGGFDAFTSTLFYSVYQDHELMRSIAEKAARDFGVYFYYQDFRAFWQEGIELSKAQDMYRQKYCGCIFSERDRYLKKAKQ
jgi:predicted adenine nucleotide alpha hydrolase (AANH) superfamily ATPase